MFLLVTCHQKEQHPELSFKDIGTPLEEIINSEPILDESENALLGEDEYNKRTCVEREFFSDVDVANMRFHSHICVYAKSEKFYVKNSSFQSPEGRMPYIEIGRTLKSNKSDSEDIDVAVYLVGGPASTHWYGTKSYFGIFFQNLLSEYDVIYIPAYYGTRNRQKAQGAILETAAKELDFFLTFVSHKGAPKVDVIGYSAGAALSGLLQSPNVQRIIVINPVLVSMKRIYRLRNEPIFHGTAEDKATDAGLVVELGDVFTLGRKNRRYYFENNADYVVRYFGRLFDFSVLDNIKSDTYKYKDCTHILVGADDKTIGQDLINFNDFPTPYTSLKGVTHNYADTPFERDTVIEAIGNVRMKGSVCGE